MNAEELIKRYLGLKSENGTMESHLEEIARFVYPRKQGFITKRLNGENLVIDIYDSTAIHANELLSSGLHGLLTSPNSQWFGLRANEGLMRDKRVQDWLREVNDIMFIAFNMPNAGFATAMHEGYLEYGAFGTECIFLTENKDRNGLLFQAHPISQMQFAESEDGHITTFLRKFEYTVQQCIDVWGDKVSKQIKEKTNPDEKIEIIHGVYPQDNKYISQYVEVKTKNELHNGFYEEQPMFAPRFYKTSFETWGRSPAFTVLPEIKMLNQMRKTTIRGAEKRVDPPLQMPSDGFTSTARIMAGGMNFYEPGTRDRIEKIDIAGDIGLGLDMISEAKASIKEAFFNDQLELNRRPQMTATEVMQRTEERLRLMSPVLGRIQNELLTPMVDRAYGILSRMGAFPDAPDIMEGMTLDIQYMSPLARANQQVEAQGISRTLEIMMPMIDRNPELIDKIDGDYMIEHVGIDMYNVDPRIFKAQEEVDATRQQRAQQQQQQQQMEIAQKSGGMNG